jgi:hypothetical protein
MKDEREFWIQVRRGLSIVTHAIDAERAQDQFWLTVLRGLNIVVRAIEIRWRLPRSSIHTIGQITPNEPPAEPLARSVERIGQTDGL